MVKSGHMAEEQDGVCGSSKGYGGAADMYGGVKHYSGHKATGIERHHAEMEQSEVGGSANRTNSGGEYA